MASVATLCLLLPFWLSGLGEPVFLDHLRFLSSDELKGRGNGQPELTLAAEHIARHFEEYGLRPLGDNESYFQEFDVTTGLEFGAENTVAFFGHPAQFAHLQMGTDYIPLSYGPDQWVTGPLAFVGFGITAPEYNYDDYREIDVRGRIVVMYEHEPQEGWEKSPFGGRELTPHATVMKKAITARQNGALAVILVADAFNHPKPTQRFEQYQQQPLEDLGIHTVLLSPGWSRKLIDVSGYEELEIRRWINAHLTPFSFQVPGFKAAIGVDVVKVTNRVSNVIGMLPGRTDEFIVVGAHYDHLGLGGKSSLAPDGLGEIHNGADDNASGTAGLLQLAHDLSSAPLQRSLVFIAFAAEELGLKGSHYYTGHPAVPLEETAAMLNLDMIGRSRGELLIGGVGTGVELKPILEELQRTSPLRFVYAETPRGPSDHLSFAARQIPVLFFFSGLHGDYHKPSDDWEKIDVSRSLQVVEVVRRVITELDRLQDGLEYVDLMGSPPGLERVRDDREYGPLFGSIPDMDYVQGGVRFAQILEGSPAYFAGIRAGDVLVEFAGGTIRNLHDFTLALRRYEAGDEVDVTVQRDEQRLTFSVKLAARP